MLRKIRKLMIMILIVFLININPVYARAGGGSSSGSGDSSSSSYYDDNTSSNHNSPYSTVESCLSVVVILGGMFIIRIYARRYKAIKMHRDAKIQLEKLDDSDSFWDEKRIKKEVADCYYAIQEAWSNQDIEALQDYLSPDLLEVWQTKLNWYEFEGKRNILKKIRLLKHDVVAIYDDEDNDKDFFWVYIEGMMDDRMVNDKNRVLEKNKNIFVEYWKFIRVGEEIYLDKVLQEDE